MHLDEAWLAAVEALPTIVWAAAADGRIDYVNRRWEQITGLSSTALLDERWIDIAHPDDLPAAMEAYRRSVADGTPFDMDTRFRMNDGTYRWLRTQAEPVRDDNGTVVRWFGAIHDVDEAHRARERFGLLGEALPLIVWSADAEGWIDWYNGRWFAYTGQTPQEAHGWGWQAAHHPDDFPEVMRRWPHAIATGEPFEMEFRLRRHDGVFHWFLTRAEPLRDEAGKIVSWHGSNVDIDAQKTALERSKRIAETLQDVFLPNDLPQYGDLRIDAAYIAAERDALVGGDWYDAFELPDGRIVFSIGDIAGHGLAASVLVGQLRQVIYTLAFKGRNPGQILSDTSDILQFQSPETFATAIVGVVSAAHDEVTFANAGHPPPFAVGMRRAATALSYASEPPLGVVCDANYSNHDVAVSPETLLLLYTDGMTEYARAIDVAEEKLKAAAALVVRDRSLAHPARAIQDLALDHKLTNDDAAILLLHFSTFATKPAWLDEAPPDRSWRFHSSDAHSAQTSRREIVAYLALFVSESADMFATELIVGELLANTVEHAPGLVEIRIVWRGAEPTMIVRDSGPGMHSISHDLPGDPLDENGRGLFLIKRLADDIAMKASPGFGTEVRVTLPFRRVVGNS